MRSHQDTLGRKQPGKEKQSQNQRGSTHGQPGSERKIQYVTVIWMVPLYTPGAGLTTGVTVAPI
jgi:hypothetical protein